MHLITSIHHCLATQQKCRFCLSIVLAATLACSAAAAGCYTAYVVGGSYAASAVVSAPTSIETTAQVDCVSGTSGCPNTGTKTVTTTTSVTHNYACVTNANSAFCGQSAYAPGSSYSGLAWTKESTPCTVSRLSLFFCSAILKGISRNELKMYFFDTDQQSIGDRRRYRVRHHP